MKIYPDRIRKQKEMGCDILLVLSRSFKGKIVGKVGLKPYGSIRVY
jgi:hypothetical protein